jgi:hypothetical protein
VDLLKMEDELYGNTVYGDAATLAISVYLDLHNPPGALLLLKSILDECHRCYLYVSYLYGNAAISVYVDVHDNSPGALQLLVVLVPE